MLDVRLEVRLELPERLPVPAPVELVLQVAEDLLDGTMKTEMFHGGDWAGVTLDELGKRIDAYIERHNTTRIKRSLGSMSPLQYRRSLGLAA